MQITQERIKELFDYRDGKLFWKKRVRGATCGEEAGGPHCRGYRAIQFCRVRILTHRVVWLYHYGYLPENDIDHINKNSGDNRIENLREISRQCNIRNSKQAVNNTSGVKGVSWNNPTNKWIAYIKISGKLIFLGRYVDLIEAVCHRLAAEQCLGWNSCDSSSPALQYVKTCFLNK